MIKVLFLKDKFEEFYVMDEESDLDGVYYKFHEYFGEDPENWVLTGDSIDEIGDFVFENLWPFDSGDYLIQRWQNSGMLIIEEK